MAEVRGNLKGLLDLDEHLRNVGAGRGFSFERRAYVRVAYSRK